MEGVGRQLTHDVEVEGGYAVRGSGSLGLWGAG